MSRVALLFLNGAILTVCAVFVYDARALVLTALMLFLPYVDQQWKKSTLFIARQNDNTSISHSPNEKTITRLQEKITQRTLLLLSIGIIGLVLLWLNPQHTSTAITILLLTALPEEWFFRQYFLPGMERFFSELYSLTNTQISWLANTTTSLLFALNHIPTQGLSGLLIFFPSLLLGWLYQKYRCLTLVIMTHALFNFIFIIYIKYHFNIAINYLN